MDGKKKVDTMEKMCYNFNNIHKKDKFAKD